MSVNGITPTNVSAEAYDPYASKAADKKVPADTKSADTNESGVIYEKSLEMPTKTYKANAELISKMKLDAQNRMEQLQSIVQQLITKQGGAYAQANDMWSFLREGNFTVDAATKTQAQADIAEDGYWGVNQTSDRILDFATALTGGDPKKMEEMRSAFKKGYEQAEKTWGGKLPEISSQTYDAVMKKFDDFAAQNNADKATVEQ